VAGGVAVGVGVGVVPRVTVSCAEVVVSKNAVIVTVVFAVTAKVVMAKLALVWPPGTLTMPGACAADALLVESVTEIPPAGAGALRNTVPVAFVPPVTLVGVIDIDCNNGGAFGSGSDVNENGFRDAASAGKDKSAGWQPGDRTGGNGETDGAVSCRDRHARWHVNDRRIVSR
jgi:hypothetical protein